MLEARKVLLRVTMLTAALACTTSLAAQVETIVPPPVPGAKPFTVHRLKVHSVAIDGRASPPTAM